MTGPALTPVPTSNTACPWLQVVDLAVGTALVHTPTGRTVVGARHGLDATQLARVAREVADLDVWRHRTPRVFDDQGDYLAGRIAHAIATAHAAAATCRCGAAISDHAHREALDCLRAVGKETT